MSLSKKPLRVSKKIKVLDLSRRLPGPLASFLLKDLGAKVLRLEPKIDPFKISDESIFRKWYQTFNASKSSFSGEIVDIVISDQKKIDPQIKYKVLIQIKSNRNNTPMHDINALSLSKSFKSFGNQSLPFVPIAGILFAQNIALQALMALHADENRVIDIYLEDIIQTLDLLNHENDIHLHNGKYPSYQIYDLKDDNKVALGAAEKHLWDKFLKTFDLPLHSDDRFDNGKDVFKFLREYFKSQNTQDIEKKLEDNDICLTIINLRNKK